VRADTPFFQSRVAPIFERHCTGCHGAEKQKAKLRLDSFDWVMRGAASGAVVEPGNVKGSELYRRITLPATDEEVMPNEGKPLLARDEIRIIELWIAGGASATKGEAEFPGVPAVNRPPTIRPPLTTDWRPRAQEIAKLEKALGVRLVARSQVPTDGLILRTASAPGRCDDATLAQLAPIAPLVVEAELARTRVTDAGAAALATWENLRLLDLTRTAVTSRGVAPLMRLPHLEALNLTDTAVNASALAELKSMPSLKRLWHFGTATATESLR
jgi:hypothetical protein